MKQRGFTILELLFAVVVLVVAGVLFWSQINNLQTEARDDKRRTAINAIYYNLEEVFYAQNHYYPSAVNETVLAGVDPQEFTDPSGDKLGTGSSDYRYEPINCTNEMCKSYSLRTSLEKEADYVKASRH